VPRRGEKSKVDKVWAMTRGSSKGTNFQKRKNQRLFKEKEK